MKLTLNDWASVAQIVGVAVTIFTWLVTKERFAEFWKRWWKLIFGPLMLWMVFYAIWRLGWLGFLNHSISLPVWFLLLPLIFAFAVLAVVLSLKRVSKEAAIPQPAIPLKEEQPASPVITESEVTHEPGPTSEMETDDSTRFPPFWNPLLHRMQVHEPIIHVYLKEAIFVQLLDNWAGNTLVICFACERPEHQRILAKLRTSTAMRDILLSLGYGMLDPRVQFKFNKPLQKGEWERL